MATSNLDNFYNRLGVSIHATQKEIKEAYFNVAKKLHPDHNGKTEAIDLFLLIQEAYDVLSSPEKRIEYNKSLPEDINPSQDILINTFYSKSSILISEKPQLIYAMINFMANIDDDILTEEYHHPTKISLVIDISTSMKGKRIEKVKSIVQEMSEMLNPLDRISITAFNDHAKVLLKLSRISDKKIIAQKLNSISPNGGTEIYKGLQAGYHELLRNVSDGYTNQLILITDGHTYGDEEMCSQLAKKAIENNVMIHCIGIGHEWNDVFLNEIAEITGGSCSYAPSSQDMSKIIFNKMRDIQRTFAKNIHLRLEPPKNVDVRYAFQLAPDVQEIHIINYSITTSNLFTDSEVSVLFEMLIDNTSKLGEGEEYRFFSGDLELTVPTSKIANKSMNVDLSLPCTANQSLAPPSETIISALRKLSLYRLEAQARDHLEKGEIDRARTKLNNLATQLLNSGNDDFAKTIYLQTQLLNQNDQISEQMKKNIKYGTKALISNDFDLK